MKEFIFQIEKEERDEDIELRIYSVNEEKKTVLQKNTISYSILLKKEDYEKLNVKSDNIKISKSGLKDKNHEEVLKLSLSSKELYEYLNSSIREANLSTYEADLPVEHEYIIDNDVSLISNSSKDTYLPLKYVAVDIETIGNVLEQEIVLISLYSPEGLSKVLMNPDDLSEHNLAKVKKSKFEAFELLIFKNEKEMLEKFREEILSFKPQLVIGWNVVDFDFKVIRERMTHHSIPFIFSDFEGECKLRVISDFFRSSTMNCPGVLIWDVIQILRTNFIHFEDYKLNTVAREVLGDNKIELENDENADDSIIDKIKTIEHMFHSDPKKLIDYNFKDSFLTSQIYEKLKLEELMCKRSIITGTPLAKVKSPIATLDIMYLKELHKRGYVANSNFNFSDTSPIEGAYVIDPKKGFYNDIFVFDFKSLYPSIIMTFNIDPFTYSKTGLLEAPNGARFNKEPGILPILIHQLYLERDNAKKEKDSVKSFALKTTMNSFYGAVASPKCRFYNKDVGEAITSFGREIIKKAKDFAQERGHKAIYGDTDSCFIKAGREFKDLEEKKKFGADLEKEFNKVFSEWVENEFGMRSFLNIELEKIFSHFFIASKKRYVGLDELSGKTNYTGMEAIRGDWTELAQNFQRKLVDLIFSNKNKEEIRRFILDYVERLKKGEYDDLLVYKKKITKPLNLYTKTTPPHVRAARELPQFSGRTVKYVMLKEGPRHLRLLKDTDKYDYEHYIDKQLKGVSDDLLDAFGIDFDEILFRKKQSSLDKFF